MEGLLDWVYKARTNHLRQLLTEHWQSTGSEENSVDPCFLRFDECHPRPAEGNAPEANARELRASGIHFGSMNWLRTSKRMAAKQCKASSAKGISRKRAASVFCGSAI